MPLSRPLRLCAAAAAACTTLALAVPAAATAAPAPRVTLLVLLRAGVVARGDDHALVNGAQAGVAALAEREGGQVLSRTTVPDTLTLRLTLVQAATLRADPLVAQVLPEASIPGPQNPAIALRSGTATKRASAPVAASCGTFKHPQLDPEALDGDQRRAGLDARLRRQGREGRVPRRRPPDRQRRLQAQRRVRLGELPRGQPGDRDVPRLLRRRHRREDAGAARRSSTRAPSPRRATRSTTCPST